MVRTDGMEDIYVAYAPDARLYQAYYGLMVCPWYAYSQTMISEVSPLQQMYVFPLL